MPGTVSETFYDLAIRAIEEQEREVSSLRTRTGTIVAAAAVASTLLAREVFAGSHPDGLAEWAATGIGLLALAAVLAASAYVLRSHNLSFSLDAGSTYWDAMSKGLDSNEPAALHIALMSSLSDMQADNGLTVNKLRAAFATALGGLLVETLGLGLGAALA